jgi:hypothetical protein
MYFCVSSFTRICVLCVPKWKGIAIPLHCITQIFARKKRRNQCKYSSLGFVALGTTLKIEISEKGSHQNGTENKETRIKNIE